MQINARATIEGAIGLPPSIALSLAKEEARVFDVRVRGIPLGFGVVRLLWTGKASDDDADTGGLILFQKDLSDSSSLTTVGRITDTGSVTGIAIATIVITPTTLPDTLPAAVSSQLWAVLSDGRQGCCALISLALTAPNPLTLP